MNPTWRQAGGKGFVWAIGYSGLAVILFVLPLRITVDWLLVGTLLPAIVAGVRHNSRRVGIMTFLLAILWTPALILAASLIANLL